MKKIKKYTSTTVVSLLAGLMLLLATPIPSFAQSQGQINDRARTQACQAIGNANCNERQAEDSINNTVRDVINILSAIGGIIAVILVIIGGVKYMTSGGDSNSAANARNTILYAIVGLIIVVFAQIIVRFVLQQV